MSRLATDIEERRGTVSIYQPPATPPEPTRRDRYGRYLVVPPTGAKPVGYTRATTIAKVLDDSSGLVNWRGRMVGLGLAARPDLVAMLATTDANDRKAIDAICERAAEAGGATIRRELGTALHAALEVSWDDITAAPAMFADDVRAVHDALDAAGLSVVPGFAERIVVNDRYQIAGTFDLILTDGTRNYMSDVKSGASLVGALAFAIQLAIYANADALYTQGAAADGSADVREPMPELDRERGVILHVQPGSGVCDLHWIDLTVGAEALELAHQVRTIRKAKPLTPIEPAQPAEPTAAETFAAVDAVFPGTVDVTVVDEAWRGWITGRIGAVLAAGGELTLVGQWPADAPTIKSGEPITADIAERIEAAVSFTEADLGLPFPTFKPGTEPEPKPRPIRMKRPVPDEGDDVSLDDVRFVDERAKRLDADGREWLGTILTAASKARRNIRMTGPGGRPTVRRFTIASALVMLAVHADDDLARALVGLAIDVELQPGHDLGAIVGSLSIDEARRLLQLASAIDDCTIAATWTDDGVEITGDIHAAIAA